jgi:hypothetical protein
MSALRWCFPLVLASVPSLGCDRGSASDAAATAATEALEGPYWKRLRTRADAELTNNSACPILVEAFNAKNGANTSYDKLVEATRAVMAAPPSAMSEGDVKSCGEALLVQHDTNRAQAVAKAMLERAHERRRTRGSFCPSAKPIPADLDHLARGPYRPDVLELDAGWRCLGFFDERADAIVAQFEVKVRSASEVEVIARRPSPNPGEPLTEYSARSWIDKSGTTRRELGVK